MLFPVWAIELDPVPLHVRETQHFVQAERDRTRTAPPLTICDEHLYESVDVRVLREQRPIEPARLVVLTIGVVVAMLRTPHLIPHERHRRSHSSQQQGEEVQDLSLTERLDPRIGRRALLTAIPAAIVINAVAIVLSVHLVVFGGVRDEIVQGESIMAGNEVDALLGLTLLVSVEVRATEQPRGEGRDHALVSLQEGTHIVAESAVPLVPAVTDEPAYLIEPRSVPRLSDELRAGEHRIGLD